MVPLPPYQDFIRVGTHLVKLNFPSLFSFAEFYVTLSSSVFTVTFSASVYSVTFSVPNISVTFSYLAFNFLSPSAADLMMNIEYKGWHGAWVTSPARSDLLRGGVRGLAGVFWVSAHCYTNPSISSTPPPQLGINWAGGCGHVWAVRSHSSGHNIHPCCQG